MATEDYMKAAPEQDIQTNIRAVIGLCQKANVQPPPPFELRFFATVMCQYTGDAPSMFSHVRCHESKAHVYWSFELQEPFSPHQDMSAEQRNLYYFAHGSDTSGIEGMIRHVSLPRLRLPMVPKQWGTIHRRLPGMTTCPVFRL